MKLKNYLNRLLIVAVLQITFINIPAQDTTAVKKDSLQRYSYSTVSELSQQLDDIFNDNGFRNANWGVVIQSLDNGEYFYKRNEDKFFIPASNLKLFTGAAGLLLLGNDYRFSTNIFLNGYQSGSTLYGDLVIQGRGDPTISGRFYNNDINYVFDTWIDSLLNLGITNIKGNIVGDDNLFDDIGLGNGWSWNYETDWYAAQSSAISFNDNCVDIVIYYNKKYDSVFVSSKPSLRSVVILNNVLPAVGSEKTIIDVVRERGTNVITVTGKFRKDADTLITYATIQNPTQYSMLVFKNRLESRGIRVNGYAIDIDDYERAINYEDLDLLFISYSERLSEIIKVINKGSQNFFAEQLLKTIGLEILGYGSAANGVTALKELFTEIGLNSDNIVMVDGSGLSHMNMVTPRQVVELLKYMYSNDDVYLDFYNSLPIAGIDGSLGKRMQNTTAQNNVRAKTGYISHVRSLSGYAFTGDSEPIAFSMIANNFSVPIKLAENIQDLVCLRLTNFRRK
ncbi:MAG: D-alanyl-D-alanine carboxypeptidase/D-alanyl-D-alanine-endopeptidase [Ignavibacterium sp.]|jgi:D-alanyl-D-alanine carboxypeptidase/D-alanyl-D-alanine-endopeptidase (penicillin-binding protein 4)|nr:D-alanyl-D-alanine carboxypeptidase/D-alanyl-D-alanine-endopeptidase [Ignavibacterium sp.]